MIMTVTVNQSMQFAWETMNKLMSMTFALGEYTITFWNLFYFLAIGAIVFGAVWRILRG